MQKSGSWEWSSQNDAVFYDGHERHFTRVMGVLQYKRISQKRVTRTSFQHQENLGNQFFIHPIGTPIKSNIGLTHL